MRNMKRLKQADLARALGISAAMVSRLKQQGMPTHSIAAAAAWRAKYLDPSLVKGVCMPGW
jgi:transcriptional regulator with XRE-family HTH domain